MHHPIHRVNWRLFAFGLMVVALIYVGSTKAQTRYTVPCGEDVHSAIIAAGSPLLVTFEPGCVHRLSKRIDPRQGQTFDGNGGAVLSGSKVLTNAQRDSNGRWYYTGQTQQGRRTTVAGETMCQSSSPRCNYPELLFVDGKPQTHVDAYSKLAAGTWFFNYDTNIIYLFDNPANRLVETSVTDPLATNCAICGGASGVTVKNLTITQFGTITESATVEAFIVNSTVRGGGWVIEGNHIHNNGAVGAVVRANGVIRTNRLENNGQAGYGAGGQQNNPACDMVVEWNLITGNNWKGVNPFFSSGGGKISYACNPVVQHNRSWQNHDSRCYWFDLDNIGIRFNNNWAGDGCLAGVYFEMGGTGIAENNTFEGVGVGGDGNSSAAILVTNVNNLVIRSNTITVCETGNAISIREDGGRKAFETHNIRVLDNVIVFACGRGRMGWDAYSGGDMPAPVYERNTYRVLSEAYKHWNTNGIQTTFPAWRNVYPSEIIIVGLPTIPTATVSPTATMPVFATPTVEIATMTPDNVPTVTSTPSRRFVIRFSGEVIIEVIEE